MKTRELRLLIAFTTVLTIIGASYAVTKVSFNNSTLINTGLNIFITQPAFTLPSLCPADGNAAYKNSGFQDLFWNLTAGDAGKTVYFCIDNQGSVQDQLEIIITGNPSQSIVSGACPNPSGSLMNYVINVPVTDTPLPPHSVTPNPVSINVCAGGNEALGTGPSFTVTVQ